MEMNMKNIVAAGLVLLLSASCGSDKTDRKWEEKENTFAFKTVVKGETTPVELEALMDIEDWRLVDSVIVCKNNGGIPYYYVLDSEDFSVCGKFGLKGNGENEWLYPHFLGKTGEEYCVLDNGRMGLYQVTRGDSSYVIRRMRDVKPVLPFKAVKSVSYPMFAYVTYSPNEIAWRVGNAETMAVSDSVAFTDEEGKGEAIRYDFSYDVSAGHAVLAGLHQDWFLILGLSGEGRISPRWMVKGQEGEQPEGTVYYTDVACGKDVYLLSQRNVDPSDASGTSSVEVYDYEGRPLRRLDLDIIASKMIVDEARGRLVFCSPMDNALHVLEAEL